MFWRTLRVVCACSVITVAVVSACGGSSSNPTTDSGGGKGGGGGSSGRPSTAGTAGMPPTVACGTATCKAVTIPIQNFTIPACCADAATNHCGLDATPLAVFGATFTQTCQPLAQPGTLDAECTDSPTIVVQGTNLPPLPGCCRPSGTCGYQLDKVAGLFQIGLGCVDSAPFLDGGPPVSCGNAAGGESGAGQGGSAGDTSLAGAGPGQGGTAGEASGTAGESAGGAAGS